MTTAQESNLAQEQTQHRLPAIGRPYPACMVKIKWYVSCLQEKEKTKQAAKFLPETGVANEGGEHEKNRPKEPGGKWHNTFLQHLV